MCLRICHPDGKKNLFDNNIQLTHILKKRKDVMSTVVETSYLL